MKTWIWTFGVGTPYTGKYVEITTDNGDGREYMFDKYGQDNCCMSYPYEKGLQLVKKYNYECIEVVALSVIESDEYKIAMSEIFNKIKRDEMLLMRYLATPINPANIIGKRYKAIKHDESYELKGEDNEDNGKG